MDNINRTFFGIIPAGALKDIAKNPDDTVVMEKLDDYTFTIATGRNGNPAEPVSWPLFPYLPHRTSGLHGVADVAGCRRRRPEPGHAAGRHGSVHRVRSTCRATA